MAQVTYRVETIHPVTQYTAQQQEQARRIAILLARGKLVLTIPPQHGPRA